MPGFRTKLEQKKILVAATLQLSASKESSKSMSQFDWFHYIHLSKPKINISQEVENSYISVLKTQKTYFAQALS